MLYNDYVVHVYDKSRIYRILSDSLFVAIYSVNKGHLADCWRKFIVYSSGLLLIMSQLLLSITDCKHHYGMSWWKMNLFIIIVNIKSYSHNDNENAGRLEDLGETCNISHHTTYYVGIRSFGRRRLLRTYSTFFVFKILRIINRGSSVISNLVWGPEYLC